MDDTTVRVIFEPLWDNIPKEDQFYVDKPLLAHYTSIEVLESIIKNDEIWLSNPLFMNDISEVKFGMFEAIRLFDNNKEIEDACQTPERTKNFREAFHYYYNLFANDHVAHTYIFCASKHDKENIDGSLSMWRGYGGNGNGAAIVFDAAKLREINESPLILAKVNYTTRDGIINFLNSMIVKFVTLLKSTYIPDEKLYLAAFELFERIKIFSLFTKHSGFEEEKEWRLVYMIERDFDKKLESMFSYFIGPCGIEPKLKFKIKPIKGITNDDISLTKIIDRIILGPSNSSPLVKETILRMFDELGKTEMKEKIHTSTIPFRAK